MTLARRRWSGADVIKSLKSHSDDASAKFCSVPAAVVIWFPTFSFLFFYPTLFYSGRDKMSIYRKCNKSLSSTRDVLVRSRSWEYGMVVVRSRTKSSWNFITPHFIPLCYLSVPDRLRSITMTSRFVCEIYLDAWYSLCMFSRPFIIIIIISSFSSPSLFCDSVPSFIGPHQEIRSAEVVRGQLFPALDSGRSSHKEKTYSCIKRSLVSYENKIK